MDLFEELDTLDPSSKLVPPRIEPPTPHKIAVLILLKQYVRVSTNCKSEDLCLPNATDFL